MTSLSNEALERVLDAGADLAQAVRDYSDERGDMPFAAELDAWEAAYQAMDAELVGSGSCAP